MATKRILIKVTTEGTNRSRSEIKGLGATAESSASGVSLLKRALGLLGGAAILRGLAELSDEFINVRNRLRTVFPTLQQTNIVLKELTKTANESRSDFAATSENFARLAVAAKQLGFSTRELLGVTRSINRAIILSGANSREARFALIQLSQAFARGVLRGDELRSVLEQLPKVGDVIAKQMGVTRFSLARLGEQGKITAKIIIEAFQNAEKELAEQFANTIPTVGQAFTVLKNNLIQLIGKLSDATGASKAFAEAIIDVSKRLDDIARVVGALAIIVGVNLAQKAVGKLISQLIKLAGVIATNPFLAFGAAILATVAFLITFSDKIKLSKDGIVTLADTAKAVFPIIKRVFQLIKFVAVNAFFALKKATAPFFEGVLAGFRAFRDAIGFILSPLAFLKDALSFVTGKIGGAAKAAADFVAKQAREVANKRIAAAKAAEAAAKKAQLELAKKTEETFKGQAAAKFNEELDRLRAEIVLLGKSTEVRRIGTEVLKIEKRLRADFTKDQNTLVRGLVIEIQKRKDQNSLIKEVTKSEVEFTNKSKLLNEVFADGKISVEQFNRKLRELRQNLLKGKTDIESGIKAGLLDLEEEFNNLADLSKNVVVDGFQKAEDALVKFVSTGKLSFTDLINSMIQDLTRLAVRQAITKPLFDLFKTSSAGKGLPGLFGDIFGGGAPAAAADLAGGASGATAAVAGGALNNFAAPAVASQAASQQPGVTVNMTVVTPDVDSFQASQGQIAGQTAASLNRAMIRNG